MQEKPKGGKKNGLIIVAAVLLVLAVGYFAITAILENNALNNEAITAEELQVTAFAKVDSFSYSDEAGNTMSFFQRDAEWVCEQFETFPLIRTKVHDMANVFADIIATRALEDHAELAEYGLDTPKYTLELHDGDYSATVLFGNPASTGWYVMVEGGEKVFVVDATLINEFVFNIYDLLKYDKIPGFLQTEVQSVDYTYNGNSYHYSLTHEEEGGTSVSTMNGAPINITYEQVMDALKMLDEWIIRGCALYGAPEEALPEYGFDQPLATMEIDVYDVSEDLSKSITIVFGGYDEENDQRFFMVDNNMQILYGDDYDSEGIIIDLTTEGLEELQSGMTIGALVGGGFD